MRSSIPAKLLPLIFAVTPVQAQTQCELELVLAIDVSRSVNPTEFRLLQKGTADAFRSDDVIEIIGWLDGGLMVTVVEWSSATQQKQVVPWRWLNSAASVAAFAAEVEDMRRAYRFDLTAPGNALVFSAGLLRDNAVNCRRQVIDIAGDGVKNTGVEALKVAAALTAEGITINGLVIRGDRPDPLPFYRDEMAIGPLSFVEIADGFDDFPRAILKKLLRELPPSLSEAPTANKPVQPL